MNQDVYRRFTEPNGRDWRLWEILPSPGTRRQLADATVSLLFVFGRERRVVAGAPTAWFDAPSATLLQLLGNSTRDHAWETER